MQIEALPRDCEKLKNIYNSLLDRIKKGEKYLDDPLISNGDKEETIPHFIKLTRAAGAILRELKLLGIDYSEQEFENGFKIEGMRLSKEITIKMTKGLLKKGVIEYLLTISHANRWDNKITIGG